MRVNEMHALYDRYHKVSSFLKSHQNSHSRLEETEHREADRQPFCVQFLQAFKFADQNLPGSGTFDLSVGPF